eukprot:Gb_40502 [translate_table: standard]
MSISCTKPKITQFVRTVYQSFKRPPPIDPDEQARNEHAEAVAFANERILPPPPRTNIMIWCCAIGCSIFAVLVILAGLIVLIGYLAFHPRLPGFYVSNASLNSLLIDSNFLLSSDMTIYLTAHNPNTKIHLYYEYLKFDLLFDKQIMSTVIGTPFLQTTKNTTGMLFRMVTSAERLEPNMGVDVTAAIQKNLIMYDFQGTVRTKAMFGRIKSVKYWLHTKCHLEFSPPPIGNGTLLSHKCTSRN